MLFLQMAEVDNWRDWMTFNIWIEMVGKEFKTATKTKSILIWNYSLFNLEFSHSFNPNGSQGYIQRIFKPLRFIKIKHQDSYVNFHLAFICFNFSILMLELKDIIPPNFCIPIFCVSITARKFCQSHQNILDSPSMITKAKLLLEIIGHHSHSKIWREMHFTFAISCGRQLERLGDLWYLKWNGRKRIQDCNKDKEHFNLKLFSIQPGIFTFF